MVSKKKACTVLSHSVVSDSLQPYGLLLSRLFCPWRFSRQEYWSGLPCPLPGDLPNPRIEPRSPTLQADSLMSEPPVKPTCMSNTSFLKTSLQVGPCQPCDPLLVTWLDWSWTPDPIRFTLCRGGNWKMSSSKPDITIQQEWFFWKSITSFLLRTHL